MITTIHTILAPFKRQKLENEPGARQSLAANTDTVTDKVIIL